MKSKRLGKKFFENDTNLVSKSLLGKVFNFFSLRILITETESYIGMNDPACHAARGKTKRNAPMFESPGILYIYMIYGMYYCLNIVTEKKDFPAAVLIRGGISLTDLSASLDGPGKLCKYCGIDKTYNLLDTTLSKDCYFEDINFNVSFSTTSRIGISKGKDKLWRYLAKIDEKQLEQLAI